MAATHGMPKTPRRQRSVRRSWWPRVATVAALLGVGALLQSAIGSHLESRFRSDLESSEVRRGRLDRVSVCLPCLSYTIHGVELASVRPEGSGPVLSAGELEVGLDVSAVFRGSLHGLIVVRDATLRFEMGSENGADAPAFSIDWDHLGRGLLPMPLGRIETERGVAVVRYERDAEPIEWKFVVHSGFAEHLASQDSQPRVSLNGTTPGDGTFVFQFEVLERDPARSSFRGDLVDVPLLALGSYLHERFGFEVEAGVMSARIDLEGDDTAWRGDVYCDVVGLEVFELADIVEEGPAQATIDGVASIAMRLGRHPDGVLRLHREVHEPFDGDADAADWPWQMTTDILRWMLRAPFDAPFRLIQAVDPE